MSAKSESAWERSALVGTAKQKDLFSKCGSAEGQPMVSRRRNHNQGRFVSLLFDSALFTSLLSASLLTVCLPLASLGLPRAAMAQDNTAASTQTDKSATKSNASGAKAPTSEGKQSTEGKQSASKSASGKPATAQELNIREYITLLRHNVRLEKSKLMAQMMQLDPEEAAKFWPIYRDYDAELAKVNDLRVQNIEDYAKAYNDMTDEKADELVHSAMQFQQQRNELLASYYGKMKDVLGGVTAARFLQVEHQLLLIVDLQIASRLPVVGSK